MLGRRISHYEILEELGRGGMGTVYRARDLVLDRQVALKFLQPHIDASDLGKIRFLHEARAASALNHPAIATVYEVGEAEGKAFISMEYVDGQTLEQLIQSARRLPIDQCQRYTLAMAQGLQAAHRARIIHRDLKPGNILVSKEGTIKIVDFGLAKAEDRTALTREGATLGTVAYMSPEQAQSREVDVRTDIWALGVILYEMLTGSRPFRGERGPAVIYSILHEEPEPLTELRSEVPAWLDRITRKCLKKDPEQRYQKVEDFLSHFQAAMDGGEVAATRRKIFRFSIWAFAPLLILLLLLIPFLTSPNDTIDSTAQIPIAVADFVNETGEQELSGLSGMLITALEQSPNFSVLTRSRMFDILRRLGHGEVTRIDESLGRSISQSAAINYVAIAGIRKFGKVYSVDLKVLDTRDNEYVVTANLRGEGQESIPGIIDQLAEETRRGLVGSSKADTSADRKVGEVTTTNLEAYQQFFEGQERLDRMQVTEAIEKFTKATEQDPEFGLAYYRLGYAYHLVGQNEQAKEQLDRAMRFINEVPEKERYLIRAYHAHLGHTEKELEAGLQILRQMEQRFPDDKEMLFFIGDWSYHNRHYEKSREYLERVLEMDPDFRRALMHLVLLDRDTGQYQEMAELARRYSPHTPHPVALYFLATAQRGQGNLDMAIQNYQRAIELAPDSAFYLEMGYTYYLKSELTAALSAVRKSLELNPDNIPARYAEARILGAEQRFSEVLKIAEELGNQGHHFHRTNLSSWALVQEGKNLEAAVEMARSLLGEVPDTLSPGVHGYGNWSRMYPYFVLMEETMGTAALKQGNREEALSHLQRARQLAPLSPSIQDILKEAHRTQAQH